MSLKMNNCEECSPYKVAFAVYQYPVVSLLVWSSDHEKKSRILWDIT